MILGVDPGREKVGLALVSEQGGIVKRAIVPLVDLEACLPDWLEACPVTRVALGNATHAGEVRTRLDAFFRNRGAAAASLEIEIIDERGSTLEARMLYWQERGRRDLKAATERDLPACRPWLRQWQERWYKGRWRDWWRAFWPRSLQTPPVPLDDLAAVVIARRALESRSHSNS